MVFIKALIVSTLLIWFSSSIAGKADVVDAKVHKEHSNTYNFTVTVLHQDAGWKHYANKWDVIDENETVLGTRILHHPHVNEQPFSRSLYGVEIPLHVKTVTIRAHDSVHKYGGKVIEIKLP